MRTRADPVRIQRLRIRNRSSRAAAFIRDVVFGVRAGHTIDESDPDACRVAPGIESGKALFARNAYHPDYGGRVAFAAIVPDADVVHRRSHRIPRPQRLAGISSGAEAGIAFEAHGPGLDPCAALQTQIRTRSAERRRQ